MPFFWIARSAPKLFSILAHVLTGILTRQSVSFMFHYLVDFLTLQKVCTILGIPMALQKVESLSKTLSYLLDIATNMEGWTF